MNNSICSCERCTSKVSSWILYLCEIVLCVIYYCNVFLLLSVPSVVSWPLCPVEATSSSLRIMFVVSGSILERLKIMLMEGFVLEDTVLIICRKQRSTVFLLQPVLSSVFMQPGFDSSCFAGNSNNKGKSSEYDMTINANDMWDFWTMMLSFQFLTSPLSQVRAVTLMGMRDVRHFAEVMTI